jgi:hypothetical protein
MSKLIRAILTAVVAVGVVFAEWRMWGFFRYEFSEYKPNDFEIASVFVIWMFLLVALPVVACVFFNWIYTPKKKGKVDDAR